MRVGLVDVKDGGSWGPVGTEVRCRRDHQFTPWKSFVGNDGRVFWTRECKRCYWTYTADPVIAGPHVLERTMGEMFGWRIAVCRCGEVLPHDK